jgi:ribosomal protein S27E
MSEKVFIKMYTEIVNGTCPTCEEYTMLVGVSRSFYRCITCGTDLQQWINGSIRYLPAPTSTEKVKKWFDNLKDG